jgi:hypothetical protein
MLEIQEDRALRFVASTPKSDGAIDEDNYRVRRGAAMKLDESGSRSIDCERKDRYVPSVLKRFPIKPIHPFIATRGLDPRGSR